MSPWTKRFCGDVDSMAGMRATEADVGMSGCRLSSSSSVLRTSTKSRAADAICDSVPGSEKLRRWWRRGVMGWWKGSDIEADCESGVEACRWAKGSE